MSDTVQIDQTLARKIEELLADDEARASLGLSMWASSNASTLPPGDIAIVLGSYFLRYVKAITVPGQETAAVDTISKWSRQILLTEDDMLEVPDNVHKIFH